MLLLSGLLILKVDVKRYALPGMQKEKKASQFLGWFNLILGILLLLVNSLLQIW
ncbi:CLC_0170 family protein [Brevibacillus centrosporus]